MLIVEGFKNFRYTGLRWLAQIENFYLLPLSVQVIVNLFVGDGHHDDEDPEQHHADQELVHHPHGHHCRLQVL